MRSAFACLLLCALHLDPAAGEEFQGEATLVFRGVRVFDGERVIPSTDVAVNGETIVHVGPGIDPPEEADVIDGRGMTLLPGLIDAHTHTFFPAQLEQAAVFGVTTELDMAGDPRFAAEMRAQQKPGEARRRADLLSAGTPATARGGHPTQLPSFGNIPTLDAPEQAQEFVDERIAEGSDYIKVIYDDGSVYGLSFPTIDRRTLEAVVKAAHTRKKLAVAHIATAAGARDAIEAGVDGLVHLFADQTIDDDLVRLAVEHTVFVVPTLTVLESAGGEPSGTSLVDDESLNPFLLPDDISNLKSAFPRRSESKVDFATARETVEKLKGAGVPILAGSDAPNLGTAHGVSLHRELELLVASGLSPLEALTAATAAPAKHFGLSDRGRIAAKRWADLVLVEGDPTRDIKASRRIVSVWKQGTRIDRDAHREKVKAELARREKARGAPPPPNSESGLVSDFEGEKIESVFGSGWAVSTDFFVGGKSKARFERAGEGADETEGSLVVTGTVQDRPQPRWAGVTFSPGPFPMAPANLSSKKAISFWAKGDGKQYYVMLFFQKRGFQPSVKTFVAGDEWKQHRFKINEFDGCDGSGITGVFFGSGAKAGDFRLQVDQVRFE